MRVDGFRRAQHPEGVEHPDGPHRAMPDLTHAHCAQGWSVAGTLPGVNSLLVRPGGGFFTTGLVNTCTEGICGVA